MKDINNLLKEHGVELKDPEKFQKEFFENYKTINEFAKKDEEINALKSNLENREKDIKELEDKLEAGGKTEEVLENTKSKLSEMKSNWDKDKQEFENRLVAQQREFAIKEKANELKFTSHAAKEHFTGQAVNSDLVLKDGKLLGFDYFVSDYKENESDAFAKQDDGGEKPKFASKNEGKIDTNSTSSENRNIIGVAR